MSTDTPTTITTETTEVDHKKIAEELAHHGLVNAFERLTAAQCKPGDTLVFQFGRKMPHDVRKKIMDGFHHALTAHRLKGFFIPVDVNFVGVLDIVEQQQTKNIVMEDALDVAERIRREVEAAGGDGDGPPPSGATAAAAKDQASGVSDG